MFHVSKKLELKISCNTECFIDQRLLELTENFVNPPPVEQATTETEETPEADLLDAEVPAEQVDESSSTETEVAVTASIPVSAGGPSGLTGSTSFTFMQESELESEPLSFENGAEWVEKEDSHEVAVASEAAAEEPPAAEARFCSNRSISQLTIVIVLPGPGSHSGCCR